MRNLVNELSVEDRNFPLAENGDSGPRTISESIDRGDGYVVFSPKDPDVGGTDIILKWGGNPPEKNKQQKDKGEKGVDQNKDKEKEEKGEKGGKSGEDGSEQDQGQEDAGSEGGGTEETGGSERGGKEKGKQSGQKGGGGKGGGKGRDKGEEEDGESEGGSGEGGEKEGKEKEKGGEGGNGGKGQGREEQGGDKGDKGKDRGGESGGEGKVGDLDKISGQDILGGGRNRGEPDDDEGGDSPRRPPHEPRERGKGKDKDGKDKDRSSKDKSGKPTDSGSDDSAVEISSDISDLDIPPASEEEDPSVLDVIFGKEKKEVSEKENKVIHKSFVFRSGKESVEVFQITPKGKFSVGDRTYIKKLANLVYYLYEPYLKAPSVDLDPSSPVIDSPISSRGLRSDRPYERPKISYGAMSTLDQVDFSKLLVFIDVSGSMDMVMVSRVINSYFQSVFTALKKNSGRITAVVVLHGTNAGVFGITSSWRTAAQTIAGVAESSRDLVGMGNGSESTLTHRIVDILRTISPIPGINKFINGQVPLIWISDFYWVINPGNQLTQFLKNKPALLISTVGDPEDTERNTEDTEDSFYSMAFKTARTIMNKVPYGALIYFPSFVGASSGSFTPGSSSGGSSVRVYAKGGAYDQLLSRKDKLGQISIVRIR
jgi:hypothetical protein